MRHFRTIFLVIVMQLPGASLTLQEAHRAMIRQNADILIANFEKIGKQSEIREARADWWPSLDLNASYGYLTETGTLQLDAGPFGSIDRTIGTNHRTEFGIDLSYPLFSGFSRINTVKSRELGAMAQLSQYTAIVNRLSLVLGIQYIRWQVSIRQIDAMRLHVAQLESYAGQVRDLQDAGMVAQARVLEADSRLASSRCELLAGEDLSDSLKREIMQLTGIDDTSVVPEREIILTADKTIAGLDSSRPEIAAVAHTIDQLDASSRLAASRRLPVIFTNAGYRYANPGLNLGTQEFMGYGIAGLQLKWNLFDGMRTSARLAQIQSKTEIARIQHKNLIDQYRKEIETGRSQLNKTGRQREAAELAHEAARAYVRELKNSLDAGVVTSTEYLNALTAESQAAVRIEQTRAAERIAWLKLRFAAGEKLEY